MGLADQAEAERLYRASGGNPFYMLELTRGRDRTDAGAALRRRRGRRAQRGGRGHRSRARRALRCPHGAWPRPGPWPETRSSSTSPWPLPASGSRTPSTRSMSLPPVTWCDRRRRRAGSTFVIRWSGNAVYESCAPGMRLAAHEHCANALAAQGAPAAMRAHHVQHAARHGDLSAVAVLREAGTAAAQRAPASAARWFELALGLLPEAAPREDRVSLLMALAETRGGRRPLREQP